MGQNHGPGSFGETDKGTAATGIALDLFDAKRQLLDTYHSLRLRWELTKLALLKIETELVATAQAITDTRRRLQRDQRYMESAIRLILRSGNGVGLWS